MILFTTVDAKAPTFKRRNIQKWIRRVATTFQKRVGDVSFIFCSDEKIIEINTIYLSHPYSTDIITFDYSIENVIAGDIFISIDTVRSNAVLYKVTFLQELYRVMIHGILHLCGLKDNTLKNKKIMKYQEDLALEDLANQTT